MGLRSIVEFVRSAATLKGSLATFLTGPDPTGLAVDGPDEAVELPDEVVVEAVKVEEGVTMKVAETVRVVVEL